MKIICAEVGCNEVLGEYFLDDPDRDKEFSHGICRFHFLIKIKHGGMITPDEARELAELRKERGDK